MVKIRIEQFSPKLGRLRDNLEEHGRRLVQASDEGFDVVIFPELSSTGYLVKDLVPEVALSPARLIEDLQRVTPGVTNLEGTIGFVEESTGHRFYNSVAWVHWNDKGDLHLVHVHRKVYLPTYGLFDEGRYFSPGRSIRTFESASLGRCGILICEDAFHLSPPLLLSIDGPEREGAGVLVIVSNSPARGIAEEAKGIPQSHQVWQNILRTYSSLLGVVVVFANRGGVEDGLTFSGGSQVVAPGAKKLAEADLFDPAVLDLDLDWPHLLREFRIGNPGTVSENTELIRRELQRILRTSIED
jgi:predicted amidohydrolase